MNNTTQKLLFFIVHTTFILTLVCLIAVLGCEEQFTKLDPDPVDNSTAPSMATINTIDTEQVTANSISISWTAPTDTGKKADGTADTITAYKVFYIEGATLSDTSAEEVIELLSNIDQVGRTAKISDLISNTEYTMVVVSTNSAGKSSTSKGQTTRTIMAPSKATLMPSAIASTSLGLVWAIPNDIGKERDGIEAYIFSYEVFYQEGTVLDYNKALKQNPKGRYAEYEYGREVVLNNLKAGTKYTIAVRTTNGAGATSISNTVTLTTKKYTKLGATGTALTNQNGTWSHDSSGKDDGTEQAGTKWSCVHDETTDLMWEVKTNKAIPDARDKALRYQWGGLTARGRGKKEPSTREGAYYDDWNDLVLHANGQLSTVTTTNNDAIEPNSDSNTALCGFNDWRVPSRSELRSIIDYTKHKPAYDDLVFPNGKQSAYWSSSPYATYKHDAWTIHFAYGYDDNKDRSYKYYTRLVRGGTIPSTDNYIPNEWQDNRYINHNNGTITDKETSLMWKQCNEGVSGSACNTGVASSHTYEVAKQQAEKVNAKSYAGHSDWRLPTIDELESLVALDSYNPNINTTMFPNTKNASYWSSSSYSFGSTAAWRINFGHGYDLNTYDYDGAANLSSYVRLVRSTK